MQGRRDNNEDRAAIENVEMVAGAGTGETVQLWAVLDGHGGQVTCSVQTCELYLTMFGHRLHVFYCVRFLEKITEDFHFSVLCRLQHEAFHSKSQVINTKVEATNKLIE